MLKKLLIIIAALGYSFIYAVTPQNLYSVKDDLGTSVTLNAKALRIISLAPDITEILFAIGAKDNIVGVVDSCDFPPVAKNIARVGSYSGLDLERIITLKPDLLITWGNSFARQMRALKTFNIPIYVTHPKHLADVAKTMQNLGILTAKIATANQAANNYLRELMQLKSENQNNVPINVFFQIGSTALFTINKNSWISEAIEFCGGHNIFADAKLIGAEINMEAVVVRAPDMIISDVSNNADWKNRWQGFQTIPAVKNHLLYSINPDLIDRAGPRLVDGVKRICALIQKARSVPLDTRGSSNQNGRKSHSPS